MIRLVFLLALAALSVAIDNVNEQFKEINHDD